MQPAHLLLVASVSSALLAGACRPAAAAARRASRLRRSTAAAWPLCWHCAGGRTELQKTPLCRSINHYTLSLSMRRLDGKHASASRSDGATSDLTGCR